MSLLFFCSVCCKFVKKNHRKLKCSFCQKYIHKCCSNLSNKEFKRRSSNPNWYCSSCNDDLHLPFNHSIDDRVFLLNLFNMFDYNGVLKEYCDNNFDHLLLDPTKLQLDTDDGNCNSFSSYYTNDEIDNIPDVSGNNLSLLNINIRSLYKNFEKLHDLLSDCSIDFQIVSLVETWQKDEPHEYFNLSGYNLEYKNRSSSKRGGGVCLYIKENIRYKLRNDLVDTSDSNNIDCLFVEIERKGLKNIIVGVIYRPPDQDVKIFNQYADQLFCNITKCDNKRSSYHQPRLVLL